MVDLNVIYPLKGRRGTSKETIQAIQQNQDFRETLIFWKHFLSGFIGLFFNFLPTCMARDDDLSISSSVCCVPYVIPAKNTNLMASMFIDHRRDDLHTSEYHEKVTFLPKTKRKNIRKIRINIYIYIFMTIKHIYYFFFHHYQ